MWITNHALTRHTIWNLGSVGGRKSTSEDGRFNATGGIQAQPDGQLVTSQQQQLALTAIPGWNCLLLEAVRHPRRDPSQLALQHPIRCLKLMLQKAMSHLVRTTTGEHRADVGHGGPQGL